MCECKLVLLGSRKESTLLAACEMECTLPVACLDNNLRKLLMTPNGVPETEYSERASKKHSPPLKPSHIKHRTHVSFRRPRTSGCNGASTSHKRGKSLLQKLVSNSADTQDTPGTLGGAAGPH